MAKRELSSTLRNLKFMQRASSQREEKAKKEEEVTPDGNFPSSSNLKRCVVIMEGDPHPGAIRGRMSFQSFNPSIDKLNEASNPYHPEASATCSGNQSGIISDGDVSDDFELESLNCDVNGDHKRKQAELVTELRYPNKSQKNINGDQESSPNGDRSSHRQPECEKLDWNVLRPPKYQSRRRRQHT